MSALTKKKKIHRETPLERAKFFGWASEEDFASSVVAWLKDQHWVVYQEVEPHRSGSIADIIAVQGAVVWIVETKLSFNPEVLWQATQWAQHAHYVSVAVPSLGRRNERFRMLERYCRQNGIGVLVPSTYDQKEYDFSEEVEPEFVRKPGMLDRVKNSLRPEHLTYAKAGNADGRRYTPWKATCDAVRRKVEETPGITMKDCIDGMKHHYSSNSCARNSMAKWIDAGKVEGVRSKRDGKFLRLYPTKEKP
jgi:hypothetical protein